MKLLSKKDSQKNNKTEKLRRLKEKIKWLSVNSNLKHFAINVNKKKKIGKKRLNNYQLTKRLKESGDRLNGSCKLKASELRRKLLSKRKLSKNRRRRMLESRSTNYGSLNVIQRKKKSVQSTKLNLEKSLLESRKKESWLRLSIEPEQKGQLSLEKTKCKNNLNDMRGC